MIKVIALFVISIITYFFSGCNSCNQVNNEPIKIGAILPLSGDAAVYGKNLQNGMNLALEEYINNNPSSKKMKIIYEDSKADPKLAISCFEKLLSVNKCKIITGGFSSSETLSIAPIAEKNKIVFISPTASSPSITSAGDYIFRTTPSDNFDGMLMAKFAFNILHLKTASILFVNNEYGQGIEKVFKQQFVALGGKINVEKSFQSGATDFKSQLSSIKSAKSNGFYIIASSELGNILKQKIELGLNQKIFTNGLAENPSVVEIAGKNNDTVFYSYPSFQVESDNQLIKSFVESYKRKYFIEPDVLGAYGYDLINIIIKSIQDCNYNLTKVKDALYQIKDFQGVTGETTFDKNGDIEKTAGIKMILDGKFKWFINNFK